jgi:hypothetical protein
MSDMDALRDLVKEWRKKYYDPNSCEGFSGPEGCCHEECMNDLLALLPALEQRERDIRHETVAKINKLLGMQSNVDLERWEQLKEHIVKLEQRERELREALKSGLRSECSQKPNEEGQYPSCMVDWHHQARAALNPTPVPVEHPYLLERYRAYLKIACVHQKDVDHTVCKECTETFLEMLTGAALNPTEP